MVSALAHCEVVKVLQKQQFSEEIHQLFWDMDGNESLLGSLKQSSSERVEQVVGFEGDNSCANCIDPPDFEGLHLEDENEEDDRLDSSTLTPLQRKRSRTGSEFSQNSSGDTTKKRRRKWTDAEDILLRQTMERISAEMNETNQRAYFSPKISWLEIAKYVPGRTAKQCRDRWNSIVPGLQKKLWTKEEDDLLIQLHKRYKNQWVQIAKHFQDRNDNMLKSRFRALKRHAKGSQETHAASSSSSSTTTSSLLLPPTPNNLNLNMYRNRPTLMNVAATQDLLIPSPNNRTELQDPQNFYNPAPSAAQGNNVTFFPPNQLVPPPPTSTYPMTERFQHQNQQVQVQPNEQRQEEQEWCDFLLQDVLYDQNQTQNH